MKEPSPSRAANRFLASLPSVLHSPAGDFICAAHDLSRGGVRLSGAFPAPSGSVGVTLRSQAADVEVTVDCNVVRFEPPGDDGLAEVALVFRDLPPGKQAILEQLISRVVEGMVPAALAALPAQASADEIRAALNKITLAHRMTLAMRGSAREREILLHDTHPGVLDALARNPNLNLPEVQKLMRLPTLLPHTLEALARSRWGANEELLAQIATHANVPLPLAQRLVSAMNPVARQKMLQRPGLHESLRAQIMKRVGR